ncbi:MAG: complex I subunit 1 family protein [Bacteroidota bacterium]
MSTILFFLPLLIVFAVLAIYAERKVSAFIQNRYGPMETGYYGLLQTVADLLKLLQKEDIVPKAASKGLFMGAPFIIFIAVFAGFAVFPVMPTWQGASINTGVFFLLAVVSLDVIGIIVAGWASNNKYSLLGAIRSASQIISYEVPLTLSVVCVLVVAQSLDLQVISVQQGILSKSYFPGEENYLFGLSFSNVNTTETGGILTWNILRAPILIPVWIVFFITTLAESNRAPFDLPEAESELVSGFHTEYSGFRWAIIMLSEYGMMLLTSLLGVILFFGSWNTPFPNIGPIKLALWTTGEIGSMISVFWAVFWLLTKTTIMVLIQMWVRWTYPRVRLDQLMNLGWKYLTPATLLLLFFSALWRLMMV